MPCTRACLQSSEPEADHADGQHGAIVDPALLVAGRDPAVLLRAVDQPLDPVPEPVRLAVEAGPAAVALLGRDDRRDAAPPELPPGLRAAVGLVPRRPPRAQARSAPAPAPDRARVEHPPQRPLLRPRVPGWGARDW